jgi:hypothetical protein
MGRREKRQQKYAARKAVIGRQNAHQDEQQRRSGDPAYEFAGRKGWIRRPGKTPRNG